MVPQEHGGALRQGGTGAGGRPKEDFRAKVREALEESGGLAFLVRVVKGEETDDVVVTIGKGADAVNMVERVRPKLKDRILATEVLIEHGHGKAPQEITLHEDTPRPTGEQLVARLLELLPRVIAILPVDKAEIGRLFAERKRVEIAVRGKVKPQ